MKTCRLLVAVLVCCWGWAHAAPEVSLIASRSANCVAPCAVFFDASDTVDPGVTARPFHELEFRWDFGDAADARWARGSNAGSNSKNTASGAVAAHVYESAGTFKVSLRVDDGAAVTQRTATISVAAADAVFAGSRTVCFSSDDDFTGCPAGARREGGVHDFTAALSEQGFESGSNKRLLFHAGHTFVAGSPAALYTTGPGIVGSFGNGKARITSTLNAPYSRLLTFGRVPLGVVRDWRVMDLEFDGQSNPNVGILAGGAGFDQITLLRLHIHDAGAGIVFAPDVLNLSNDRGRTQYHIWDQLALADSVIERDLGGGGHNLLFLSATRLMVMGNLASDSRRAEHVLRIPYAGAGVVSNNDLQMAAEQKNVFTLRAPNLTPGGNDNFSHLLPQAYTEKVVVSDNKFAGAGSAWPVHAGPANRGNDSRVRNIVFERNWYTAGPGTQNALTLQAGEVTVRNEIIDISGAAFHTGISLLGATAAPAANNVRIYHNTLYSASSGDFHGVRIAAGVTGVSVLNNLAYAPASGGAVVVDAVAAGDVTACSGCNTADAQVARAAPPFAARAPATPQDFRPVAKGAAVLLKACSACEDFFGRRRAPPLIPGAVAAAP
jgi:hypothetical protein